MSHSCWHKGVASSRRERLRRLEATAEQIAFDFPTLTLADIHAVIAYYLRHREEVERYLADLQVQAGEVRKRIEPVVAGGEIRERLLARRADKEAKNAADHDG